MPMPSLLRLEDWNAPFFSLIFPSEAFSRRLDSTRQGNPTDEDKSVTLTATLASSRTDKTEKAVFQVTLPKMSAEEILEKAVHWMRLNEGNAVLTPTMGKKQIRDPFIMRKKDGSFAIFATNGWNSDKITIWDSNDLTAYENERLVTVSIKDYKGLSGRFV